MPLFFGAARALGMCHEQRQGTGIGKLSTMAAFGGSPCCREAGHGIYRQSIDMC